MTRMSSPKSSINLSCLRAVFTNCTSFKPLCTKKCVPSNGRGSLCKNFFLPFSAWFYLFTINLVPHELFKNAAIFSRFGMAPRPLAPARAMKSRTCADVFQPCRLAPLIVHRDYSNRPYSYSRYWTGTSWQLRLMRGI